MFFEDWIVSLNGTIVFKVVSNKVCYAVLLLGDMIETDWFNEQLVFGLKGPDCHLGLPYGVPRPQMIMS